MNSLSSIRTFKSIASEELPQKGNRKIVLDSIPKTAWNKYDGNTNWAMEIGGPIEFHINGRYSHTMVMIHFHLIGKSGKTLKTEDHMVPMERMDDASIEKATKEIVAARREVEAGRGDTIPDDAWYAGVSEMD
jgi:hypothetical protein